MKQAEKVLKAYVAKYDTKVAREIVRYMNGYEQLKASIPEARERSISDEQIEQRISFINDKAERLVEDKDREIDRLKGVNMSLSRAIECQAKATEAKYKKLKGKLAAILVNS